MADNTDPGRGHLLVGTYTSSGASEGIYVYECDYASGALEYKGSAAVDDPSYITLDSSERYLYAVSEQSAPSWVNTMGFDPSDGGLTMLGRSGTEAGGLCNIVVSPDGRYLLTSNYGSGSVSVFGIGEDGRADRQLQYIRYEGSGPVSRRQDSSHIHCVRFCKCGKYVFITDLGNDAVYRYNVSPGSERYLDPATFKEFRMEPGSGPRHLVFAPDGDHLYLANELTASVTVFSYEHGDITPVQNIPASRTGTGDGGDIKVSPDGRNVYMSVRMNGDDGIAVFDRDKATGLLRATDYRPCVEHPRSIELTPGGKFLLAAGMKADKLQVFARRADGSLRDTGRTIGVPSPTCLVFSRD